MLLMMLMDLIACIVDDDRWGYTLQVTVLRTVIVMTCVP
jgi:hypothetical protein